MFDAGAGLELVAAGHLGGYVVGPYGDPATYYPELWQWLVEERKVQSVVDVGCGEGHAVRFFEGLGVEAVGIDGVSQEHPRILRHDYTLGPWSPSFLREGPEGPWRDDRCDLVWSCEFVEHVEERFLPNFLATFGAGHYVLMTHADPGQLGHHHVNCRSSDYWVGTMAAVGYRLDSQLTAQTRELAGHNTDQWNHYVRSGLAFARCQ